MRPSVALNKVLESEGNLTSGCLPKSSLFGKDVTYITGGPPVRH
jgi:hypothetical protein